MNNHQKIIKELNKLGSSTRASHSQRFFKTGPGEYGEGDVFLGLSVPEQRTIAKSYLSLTMVDIQKLLNNKIHEYRLVGLLILVAQYQQGNVDEKRRVYNFYLKNTRNINNWDLVDLSAPNIVGHYLLTQPRKKLYTLAKSELLWERRIGILATFAFIRINDFKDALALATILRDDEHDLMHKAVGWMLREVGKRNQAVEEVFLKKHYKKMPRTMLRYAIERFSDSKRKFYMKK